MRRSWLLFGSWLLFAPAIRTVPSTATVSRAPVSAARNHSALCLAGPECFATCAARGSADALGVERRRFATSASLEASTAGVDKDQRAGARQTVTRRVARGPELSQISLRMASHDRLPVACARGRRDRGDLPRVMCVANATLNVVVSRRKFRDRLLGSGRLQCWNWICGAPREHESGRRCFRLYAQGSSSASGRRTPAFEVERFEALPSASLVAGLDELAYLGRVGRLASIRHELRKRGSCLGWPAPFRQEQKPVPVLSQRHGATMPTFRPLLMSEKPAYSGSLPRVSA